MVEGVFRGKPIDPGMANWWKKYQPINGMVTESISPYRMKAIQPFFKHFPQKVAARVGHFGPRVIPPLLSLIYLRQWCEVEYDNVSHTCSTTCDMRVFIDYVCPAPLVLVMPSCIVDRTTDGRFII